MTLSGTSYEIRVTSSSTDKAAEAIDKIVKTLTEGKRTLIRVCPSSENCCGYTRFTVFDIPGECSDSEFAVVKWSEISDATDFLAKVTV